MSAHPDQLSGSEWRPCGGGSDVCIGSWIVRSDGALFLFKPGELVTRWAGGLMHVPYEGPRKPNVDRYGFA